MNEKENKIEKSKLRTKEKRAILFFGENHLVECENVFFPKRTLVSVLCCVLWRWTTFYSKFKIFFEPLLILLSFSPNDIQDHSIASNTEFVPNNIDKFTEWR